jgi:hypothetical protein
MYTNQLPVKTFLRHLRRQSIPELLDGECLKALDRVEEEYGDVQSFGAGLEVRLGSPQRYADYILCTMDDSLFPNAVTFLEMDYQSLRGPGEIRPCLFLNTWEAAGAENPEAYWDHAMTVFAGQNRAENLKETFHFILDHLPGEVQIKQIGSMARPGEADSLRVVLLFSDAGQVPETLAEIGWPGDAAALGTALEPWDDVRCLGVNIDLDGAGIRKKTGIEVYPFWKHPVLVNRMISRLEKAGLCREDKGQALRRWVRIPPDQDPFIQTLISHYKLNYANGQITEAKAYLEQSPFPKHRFFEHAEK